MFYHSRSKALIDFSKKIQFLLAIGLFLLAPIASKAQTYGNEWIDYNLSYYKIPITQTGVYRISEATLQAAGIPISSIDPRNLQIFGRGEEIALHIEGEADGIFDPTDFIEFYAESNDGWYDEGLYDGVNNQANPHYSLFNDTAHYFLTWNNSISNLRMTPETDVNFGAFSTSNFVWYESLREYHTTYFDGQTFTGGATDPGYVATEGWFDGPLNLGASKTKSVSTTGLYPSGPPSIVEFTIVGASNHDATQPDHHIRVEFASSVYDTIYEGYHMIRKRMSVASNSLVVPNTSFLFRSINDLGSGVDRSTLGYLSVTYPKSTSLNGENSLLFELDNASGQTKSRLEFGNFNTNSTVWLYDLSNNKRVITSSGAGSVSVLVPNAASRKSCYLFSESAVQSIATLRLVNGTGIFTDFLNFQRDSAFLIVTHPKLVQAANMYSNYRNLSGHNGFVMDVTELYDQFAYGINTHPYAIRNAVEYLYDKWPSPPKYLFLFGKSVRARLCRKNAADYAKNLVPSMGNPASDIMITSGLKTTILEPLVATGRLSASTIDQGIWYLNKVMEYEQNTVAEWMKTVLHFAGGSSQNESNRFAAYLSNYEQILEDTLFGGTVHTFRKSTTSPIQITLSDSISNLVNQGVSIMNFFGHASASGGFDQNIDDPENYQNKGKYPLLIANSCFAGDIHGLNGFSTSEQFILIKDRGMIGFIASSDLGFESLLNLYSENLIRELSQRDYGGDIGVQMNNTIRAIQGNGLNLNIRSVCLQMTLHGDPAVKVNYQIRPDYHIDASSVSFNPDDVTTESDSFELNLEIANLGKAIDRDIVVTCQRMFPNAQFPDTTYEVVIPGVRYKSKVVFKMPVDAVNGDGLNRFNLTVDALATTQELREDNNFISIELFIRSGSLVPVIPYDFAIVPNQGVELIASTGYAFEKDQQYIVELDTTDTYNSPAKSSVVLNNQGGLLKWKPSLLNNMPNNQVYFWRASKNESDPSDLNWKESSFQYIKGKNGWSQDHFFQFKNDEYLFVNDNRSNRKFEFESSLKRLTCVTVSSTNFGLLGNVDYRIDANRIEYGGCQLGPAIIIAVLDSLNFEPWGTPYMGQNAANDFGQLNKNGNCGKVRVQNFFIFQANSSSQLAGLKDMIQNKIPDGYYVLAYTWVRNDFSKWDAIDPGMRQVFINLGANDIGTITNDTLPYIFFCKKGDPTSVKEVVGNGPDELITLKADLMNNTTYGEITSAQIGPAAQWDSLVWDYNNLESPTADEIELKVTGITYSGVETPLINSIGINNLQSSLNTQVNAQSHPFLKLTAIIEDDSLQTPPQLEKWQVIYEGVPELALNANAHFEFHNDTLSEGEQLRFSIAVENISEYDTDSLLIEYYILDRNRERIDIPYNRVRPLKADSVFITSIEYSTLNLAGANTFVIDVNPNNDQPEQHHFNNIGKIPFYVLSDKINPVLDVTFDGIHILDGDIVSPKTEIIIQLSDDNKFLELNDTSDFRLWITNPMGQEELMNFSGYNGFNEIQFIPGSLPKNQARIVFNPDLRLDGMYKLRVQAADRSKNESGDNDYQINFEVINKSTITNMINYPNPFTTSTRFVFVLTGSKIPDAIQIQIMTITGKLVKTIDQYEIGPINIGRNITQYYWDGRDDYGDRLANGVYLYRVNAQIDGQNIEHRSTSADKYFKKGFGKMYLMK